MRRTQIYLTEEEHRRVARRAADEGVSNAEIIRRLLDQGLGIDDGRAARIEAIRATAGALTGEDGDLAARVYAARRSEAGRRRPPP